MKDKYRVNTNVLHCPEGTVLTIEYCYNLFGRKNTKAMINLGWLTEVKEPLLVTHDGVEIYDPRQVVYWCEKERSIWHIGECVAEHPSMKLSGYLIFSTKNLRNLFIAENEKRYSEKDVSGLIDKIIFNLSALEDKKSVNIIAEVQTIYQSFKKQS